jgi:hypothetical protein
MKNGGDWNAGGFVEPLEATSLGAIATEVRLLTETLIDSDFEPGPLRSNKQTGQRNDLDNIRRFLAIHYRFNSRLETPFWRACHADTDLAGAEEIVEFFQENGPSAHGRTMLLNSLDQFTIDGWLALLVGMKVPCRRRFEPSAAERQEWRRICEHFRTRRKARFRQGGTDMIQCWGGSEPISSNGRPDAPSPPASGTAGQHRLNQRMMREIRQPASFASLRNRCD